MTFASKQITLTFTLGQGQTFGSSGQNQVTVAGLRTSVKITVSVGTAPQTAQIRVFGLTPTVYNQLTAIYQVDSTLSQNSVTIQAGDASVNSLPTVFLGQITMAQIDLNSQPDVVMNITAISNYTAKVSPVIALSYPAGTTVVEAMQSIATAAGVELISNNVTGTVPPGTYLPGTADQQRAALADQVGINAMFIKNTLVLWNKSGPRNDLKVVPEISYLTNMIGYPSYSTVGIGLKCYFNPNIEIGGRVKVTSSLKIAHLSGLWYVTSMTHTLDSETPDGQWCTECQCQGLTASGAG